jgi:hypothetical protein
LLNHPPLSVAEKIYFQPVIKKPTILYYSVLKAAIISLLERMVSLIINAHSKYTESDL